MAAVNPDLEMVLTICGISQQNAGWIATNEGFVNMDDLGVMEDDKVVLEMAKRMASRPTNAGRVLLGTV